MIWWSMSNYTVFLTVPSWPFWFPDLQDASLLVVGLTVFFLGTFNSLLSLIKNYNFPQNMTVWDSLDGPLFLPTVTCLCLNCEMYLSKLEIGFVEIKN